MSAVAKVSQSEADAYLHGWAVRHRRESPEQALKAAQYSESTALVAHFGQGYKDCGDGKLNFDKCMGPNDFEPQIP